MLGGKLAMDGVRPCAAIGGVRRAIGDGAHAGNGGIEGRRERLGLLKMAIVGVLG